jgi:alkanesulfonate monooxygenase SsuD/methylene tetrahydromethanopterin reductase-like flavin-dependent oxidoreductase (luciferase family)
VTFGYVDETDEAARAKAGPHLVHSFDAIYGFGSATGLADTYVKRGEHGAAEIARNMQNPQYYYDNNLVFVGSPKTVVEQIKAAATEGCFNTIFFEFNIGTLPEEDLMRSIRLFGTEVIPNLRDFEPPQFRT